MSGRFIFPILALILSCAPAFPRAFSVPSQRQGKGQTNPKEAKKLEQQAARLDREARHAKGNARAFESLSKQLGIPIETLKSQQQNTKFSFGQLFIANALAKEAGKTFDDIANEFKTGRGWGAIAEENDVKLGKLVREMRRLTAEMRSAHEEEMRGRSEAQRKPEAVGHTGEPGMFRAEEDTRSSAASRSHRRGQ